MGRAIRLGALAAWHEHGFWGCLGVVVIGLVVVGIAVAVLGEDAIKE